MAGTISTFVEAAGERSRLEHTAAKRSIALRADRIRSPTNVAFLRPRSSCLALDVPFRQRETVLDDRNLDAELIQECVQVSVVLSLVQEDVDEDVRGTV